MRREAPASSTTSDEGRATVASRGAHGRIERIVARRRFTLRGWGRAARHGHPRRGEPVGRLSGRRSALPTRTSPSTPCSATTSARLAGSRGVDASPDVERDIVPHRVLCSFTAPVGCIHAADQLVVRTNCAGEIEWSTDGWRTVTRAGLAPSGGVMAGPSRHAVTLRPAGAENLTFRLRCGHPGCVADTALCRGQEFAVEVGETP